MLISRYKVMSDAQSLLQFNYASTRSKFLITFPVVSHPISSHHESFTQVCPLMISQKGNHLLLDCTTSTLGLGICITHFL